MILFGVILLGLFTISMAIAAWWVERPYRQPDDRR